MDLEVPRSNRGGGTTSRLPWSATPERELPARLSSRSLSSLGAGTADWKLRSKSDRTDAPIGRAPLHDFVRSQNTGGGVGRTFQLQGGVVNGEAAAQLGAYLGDQVASPSSTRWAVSAVSVVLMPQMCRS